MKNLILPLTLLGLSGCAAFAFGLDQPSGALYTDADVSMHATDNNLGRKKGEACATSILGLVTTGDAGIKTAAEAAGITQIAAVDTSFTQILGIWSKFCVVVSGDAGGSSGE